MKLIHTFSSSEIKVEIEDVLESFYDLGEYIEFEGREWMIVEKRDKRFILRLELIRS